MNVFLKDRYRGVIVTLLGATLLGMLGAVVGGIELVSPVLFAVAITLGISGGILFGVAAAQAARKKPPKLADEVAASSAQVDETAKAAKRISVPKALNAWFWQRLQDLGQINTIGVYTAISGYLAIGLLLLRNLTPYSLGPLKAGLAAALCFIAAGLFSIAARYLREIDPAQLPESAGLCRLSRVLMWVLVMAGASMGFAWLAQLTVLRIFYFAILAIDAALCYELLGAKRREDKARKTFSLDLRVLSLLGSRTNVLASILDTVKRQLGIDLRSTWALTIVRHSVEPLVIALCLLGWLSTSLTIVRVNEQALVERLGVQVQAQPLLPGLHLHWPWPIVRVFPIPVQRVQSLTVGHEGEEEGGGPENVLWARQHAANEYTLLLGNGRDLITIDASVQFRIKDARAWLYNSQNPADALRAIAYRAVMRSTVNRTLSEALSQNVVKLTAHMREMVQHDADALGLGIEVVAFTVGGMHPPVMVASDYQAVVSAELGKVTAVVNAQAYRNRIVPAAAASVLASKNIATAEGAEALARAAGEAWSFHTLESQYRAAREEYLFRRRLETLENNLAGRSFTVVDSRIQRDGGELWLMP